MFRGHCEWVGKYRVVYERNNLVMYIENGRTTSLLKKWRGKQKQYILNLDKWRRFIVSKGGSAIPVSSILVLLYLTEQIDKHVIYANVYSIKWPHCLKGLPIPTENNFVKSLLESVKRALSKH